MRVQQHGRRTLRAPGGGRRPRGHPTGTDEHLDVVEAGAAQQRDDGVGARGHVRLVELGVGHARDPDEGLEVGAQRTERGGGPRTQRVRPVAGEDGRVRGCVGHGQARYSTTLAGCSDAATTPSP